MKRWIILIIAITAASLGIPACSGADADTTAGASAAPADGSIGPLEGRIVFDRLEGSSEDTFTYTVNPDGTDVRPLFTEAPSESARWSPDGTQIQINCCDDGMAAHLIDPETGRIRRLPLPDPRIETFCGGAWSPDGAWLTCEGYGMDDPGLNGIYLLRVSDRKLVRVTTNPDGSDMPGDFSPDGSRLVFARADAEGNEALFLTNVDGSGLREIKGSSRLVELSGGRWSPDGTRILFAARRSDDHHKAIWVVDPDSGSLDLFPIARRCGGLWSDPRAVGCASPAWSPDGTQVVFTLGSSDGEREDLFVVNADGTGVTRLTHGGGDHPDWGAPPSA